MTTNRTLVLEDDAQVALELEGRLKRIGYTKTSVVASAEEALELVTKDPPDLALVATDLCGQLDGIETARRIQSLRNIPVVYLVSDFDETVVRRAKGTTNYSFLVKPFSDGQLGAAVETVLQHHRAMQTLSESEEKQRLVSRLTSDYFYSLNIAADGSMTTEWIEGAHEQVTGLSFEEMSDYNTWIQIVHPADIAKLNTAVQKVLGNRSSILEYRIKTPEGKIIWLQDRTIPVWDDNQGRVVRVVGAVRDISAQKAAEERLYQRLALEQTLFTISSRFMRSENVDSAIDKALADLGQLRNASRVYLLQYDPNGISMRCTHEWCAPEVTPEIDNLQYMPLADFQWINDEIRRRDAVLIKNVAALPDEEAAFRNHLEAQDIKSLAAVPLMRSSEIQGFLGFDHVSDVEAWDESDLLVLRLVAEIIAIALERKHAQDALKLSESRFRHIVEQAPFAMQIYATDGGALLANQTSLDRWGITPEIYPFLLQTYNLLEDEQHQASGTVALFKRAQAGESVFVPPSEYKIPADPYDPSSGFIISQWSEGYFYPVKDETGGVVEIVMMQQDVTERVRVEQELRRAEERVRTFIESADDMIYFQGLDGSLSMLNEANTRITGYSQEEFAANPQLWRDIVHPEDLRVAEEFFSTNPDGVPYFEVEYRLQTKGGEQRWIHSRMVGVKDETGQYIGYNCIDRDLTKQKRTERTLRQLEERFSQAFQTSAAATSLSTLEDDRFIEVNAALLKTLGYAREELIGQTSIELGLWADLDTRDTIMQALLAHGSVRDVELKVRAKSGEIRSLFGSAELLTLGSEKVLLLSGIDITERKEAAHSLAESRKRFRELAENIREVFWLFDWNEQKVLYVSPAYEAVWGRRATDLYARYEEWSESVHPDDVDYAAESFARIVETGGGDPREYRIVRPNGEVRWVSDRGFPIYDEAGRLLRIAGLAEDITLRKEQERERDSLIAELEQKNAELERFTYTVSHDLKSPLITIKGFLGYLKQDVDAGNIDQFEADLERIDRAATTMSQLLEELLELSRLGRIINPTEHVSLVDLAGDVVAQFTGRLSEGGVQVTIDPSLPTVVGDRVRLFEVFENLVDNALRHMGEKRAARIDIGVRNEGEADAVIMVSDNGIGIDPRYHERVFDLFEKLNVSSEGSGIGLAIVKRIVEVHNGHIWVESEGIGHGTTFCFTLPGAIGEAAKGGE